MASTQDSSSVIPTDSDVTSDSGMSGLNNSSARDESSQDEDSHYTKLTLKWINEFFKKDWKTYYRTLELNEKLYFHYKGKAVLANR
jgi:hypothetical protein